jgi:hypothetical protein
MSTTSKPTTWAPAGEEFYILINHKSAKNYGINILYRRKIAASKK